MKNSDVGLRLDLKAEVFVNSTSNPPVDPRLLVHSDQSPLPVLG